jgi:hypothetical protein
MANLLRGVDRYREMILAATFLGLVAARAAVPHRA